MFKTLLPLSRSPPLSLARRVYSAKMSTNTPPSPKCPKFVSVEGADIHARSKPDGIRFRLVSYNILAQVYVKSSLFPHSPAACLKWKARSQAILTVLKSFEADFLCLQEVDEYESFYKRNMESQGYSSVYIQRSGQKRDGCAIFYNANHAELLTEERIEYNDLVDTVKDKTNSSDEQQNKAANRTDNAESKKSSPRKDSPPDRGDPNDPCVRLKRDCVGIMAAFRIKNPFHHIVIVANTHLYWDPEWADVKLAQANYLLARLAEFKTTVSDQFECDPSVFLAGDFNSIPGDKVYQYLVSGSPSSVQSGELLSEEKAPIRLSSVHAATRGEPPFTNCTPSFTNTLDYIFFSSSEFVTPVSILELPEPESPDVAGCLPNVHHPSDHLPIGAVFEITQS